MSFRRIVTAYQRKNEINHRGWDGNREENKMRRIGFGIKETGV
jgi:hypothetical protein